MDNDNKIVPKKSTTSLFLDDLDIKAVSEKDEYVLHDEFKESKKNRSWGIIIILVIMTLSLGAASWGITRWIEARNVIKDYELDEFQDVDLMDVLNQVRKIEIQLEEAERQLVALRREYQKARESVQNNAEQQIRIIDSRDLAESELERLRLEVFDQRTVDLQAVDDEFVERIAILEESINVLREQMAAYDSGKIQQAQEYESVLANEKQKYELEKQQIIASYEERLLTQEADYSAKLAEFSNFQDEIEDALKNTSEGQQNRLFNLFNPIISEDDSLNTLVDKQINRTRFEYNLAAMDSVWAERGYIEPLEFRYLDSYVDEWRELMGFMNDIPFTNDAPRVLEQLEYRYLNVLDLMSFNQIKFFEKLHETETNLNRTTASLEDSLADLDEVEARLNDKISQNLTLSRSIEEKTAFIDEISQMYDVYRTFYERFSYSLIIRLRDLGGQGIVLDPRESGELLAYLDPFLNIPPGTVGYVFGLDNEYVGQISLNREELFYRVEILDIEEDRELNAFDRIFLRMNSLTEDGSDAQ